MSDMLYRTQENGLSYLTVDEPEYGPVTLQEQSEPKWGEGAVSFLLSVGEQALSRGRDTDQVTLTLEHLRHMLPILQRIVVRGRMPCAPEGVVPLRCRVIGYSEREGDAFRLYQVSFAPWSPEFFQESKHVRSFSSREWPQLLSVTPHPTEFQTVWGPHPLVVESGLLEHVDPIEEEFVYVGTRKEGRDQWTKDCVRLLKCLGWDVLQEDLPQPLALVREPIHGRAAKRLPNLTEWGPDVEYLLAQMRSVGYCLITEPSPTPNDKYVSGFRCAWAWGNEARGVHYVTSDNLLYAMTISALRALEKPEGSERIRDWLEVARKQAKAREGGAG